MRIVCDTDVVSRLAKIKSLKLLELAFPKSEFLISVRVFDELSVSKRKGHAFPDRIFNFTRVAFLNKQEVKEYKEMKEDLFLSRTDIYNMVLAKRKNHVLLSDDQKLLKKARENRIKSYNLLDLFRYIYIKEKKTKKEINRMLNEIEKKDNTLIKNREKIFTG